MKNKEELQKEYDLLDDLETKIQVPIEIEFPNGIKIKKTIELDIHLSWVQGTNGNVWIFHDQRKDTNCMDLQDIADEIRKQYDAKIKQFCKESDEFEAAGGEADWF